LAVFFSRVTYSEIKTVPTPFIFLKRKARKERNPKAGEAVKIAAKFAPKFKPARAFKEAVQ
jgi:nucleoid DNA-binding protein